MFVVDSNGAADVVVGFPLDAVWEKLTENNVACRCCSSDLEYIDRVNEVADIIGKPHWRP